MSEVDEFLSAVLPRQHEADLALHNGDALPRKMLWSHGDPVSVLGAAKTVSGWPEVEGLFDWLASISRTAFRTSWTSRQPARVATWGTS
jgi:hypothetical protein